MTNRDERIKEIIVDEERLFLQDRIPSEYKHDEYLKDSGSLYGVVLPQNKKEIQQLVTFASTEKIPMIVQGAGTGLSGATVPQGGELVIDLHLMNHIVELDEDTMTLTVEPGVLLGEIHDYVEKRGYFYPPDPGSKHSSIGGNVATNAGGMRAVKYGVTRDYIRQLDVILPDSREMSLGSLNIKSSSGYDLKNLFIGSEGTLGVTTLIKLKLIPLPKAKLSIIVSFQTLEHATDAVLTILRNGIDPATMEFFEKEAISLSEKENRLDFPSQAGNAYLLITLDGDSSSSIESRLYQLEESVQQHHALEVLPLTDPKMEHTAWFLRDQLLTAVVNYTEQVTLDEVVPVPHISELYHYTKELERESGLKMISFGHAGDGNLHTCITRGDIQDEKEWQEKRDEVLDKLYEKIQELGGLPSAEHGIGMIKKKYFYKMIDPVNIEVMKQIKKIFDPENLMNPNKVL